MYNFTVIAAYDIDTTRNVQLYHIVKDEPRKEEWVLSHNFVKFEDICVCAHRSSFSNDIGIYTVQIEGSKMKLLKKADRVLLMGNDIRKNTDIEQANKFKKKYQNPSNKVIKNKKTPNKKNLMKVRVCKRKQQKKIKPVLSRVEHCEPELSTECGDFKVLDVYCMNDSTYLYHACDHKYREMWFSMNKDALCMLRTQFLGEGMYYLTNEFNGASEKILKTKNNLYMNDNKYKRLSDPRDMIELFTSLCEKLSFD